jgi:hypothetical protein
MTEFDPERFEDKYEHYFTELQKAYKAAFDEMSERHDSEVVHAVDQLVLAESEPFYEGDGSFRVELPEDAHERIVGSDVVVGDLDAVLADYTDEIDTQLQRIFEFE